MRAISRGADLDCVAYGDDGADWKVGADDIGQIFFVALNGFKNALRSGIFDVIARITVELLDKIDLGEVPPARCSLGFR